LILNLAKRLKLRIKWNIKMPEHGKINMTPKHEKLLAMASTKTGASPEIYQSEANDLLKAGKLVKREVFTTGGNRKLRLFLAESAIPDPNDVDFVEGIKKLLGIDAKNVEVLLPKLDPATLIDIASAVTNSNKQKALSLIRIGRENAQKDKISQMSEDQLVNRKPIDKKSKEKTMLLDTEYHEFNVGDAVEIDGEEATVKLTKGPDNTVGVMIKGKMQMVDRKDVKKIEEGVLGMTGIPDLRRMQALAGIAEVPEVSAPEIATVEFDSDMDMDSSDSNSCGTMALALLDKVKCMLPDLRLAEISAIRKVMMEIQTQMNESVGYKKIVEGRRKKV
jgi:hypothetical protein